MDGVIEFNHAAFKHGVTEADIENAFEQWLLDQPLTGETNKHLLVGFDRNANLLEILYNVTGYQEVNVFHAMKCRPAWRRIAEERQ
ncbi:MAG: hypothetical protein LBT00_13910 [Spirochaetaceae bacterium]|jgi:hypothetical protein|nr:hypothetical protein [Spirochaetaceae bacterium]